MKSTIGIIGFGSFGRFMVRHLAPSHSVKAWNITPVSADTIRNDQAEAAELTTLADAASCDVVIMAVTTGCFREVLSEVAPHLRPGSLLVDVASVKMLPAKAMLELAPKHVDIVATHPMFGPQSGANGIAGLPCALCPVRVGPERLEKVRSFLKDGLKLEVVDSTPEEHDQEVCRVQAVTHYLCWALKRLSLTPSAFATPAYRQLLAFAHTLRADSWDLFLTIERDNPFAAEWRKDLRTALEDLENRIQIGEEGRPEPFPRRF